MDRPLNWRELERLAGWIAPELEGMFVDRVVVPERPEFPEGFLKNEWCLRLTSRRREAALVFSVRPGKPYLGWIPGKGPKASPHATRSGFDLSLNKRLEGRKVLGIEAIEKERTVVLWMEGDPTAGGEDGVFGLVFTLIPALPEALLIEVPRQWIAGAKPGRLARALHSRRLAILARSRNVPETEYLPPDGSRSPLDLVVRATGFGSLAEHGSALREAIEEEAFEARLARVRARVGQDLKLARGRIAQNEKTLKDALGEPDYRHRGDLLKSVMGSPPPLADGKRKVFDWLEDREVELVCDPKLSVKDQVERFYSLAKRKDRRISEAKLRIETFRERAAALDATREAIDRIAISKLRGKAKIDELEPYETKLGIAAGGPELAERKALAPRGGKAGWSGKTFISKEGLPILVGRSKDENLELTFKFARGNDLWMHVRGKPGAHVVIPLRSKKNASLETLLDAAFLCLHYSGGADWGKTEVDYAAKKRVKRIRDSSEASYTHNKTLVVEMDSKRLRELLSQENL